MKIINFINPACTEDNLQAYSGVVTASFSGFGYKQTSEMLANSGWYIPEDQYLAMNELLNIQTDLDIGTRQEEY